ncbi:hypothetical protein GCM10011331_08240 [Flavimobilis marinus]|uniref:ABC-type multidrug transport system, ATPase component n=1 Tax=Flavimobilis marinus TaxID=285351 RepID=A0A1I2CKV2_9MICO|nr:ATP-binding cassette domain-containing protein [Flavimobilis marinus]GHG47436.1 hypothetical protein GCM10011331_08240 [Flavimobilis marinus]SFE68884.1 ABC-type multidrug transport system, ATPase component [Flavimobilis marinus]
MTTTPPAAIVAKHLQLDGPHGPVYGPLDMYVETGDLVVLQGPQGSGRTSLLLTLAGRMRPSASTVQLTVGGQALPARRNHVQRRAAIAGFAGIDDLEPDVTVADAVRERLAWLTPWHRRTPSITVDYLDQVAAPVFGHRPVPTPRTLVHDLDEVDGMLLRIAVALLAEPELLVVDDLDQVHDTARRQIVWDRLAALAAAGLTVVASVASAGEVDAMTWVREPRVVRLATGPQLETTPTDAGRPADHLCEEHA